MKTSTLYDVVTTNILAELQPGAVPWLKPWKGGNVGILPANAITKRSYSGINVFLLWYQAGARGYQKDLWLTYKQAEAAGGKVRKGEKGTHVVFTKPLLVKEKDKEDPKTIQMLKTFSVFNVAQIDGLALPAEPERPTEVQRHEAAEAFIMATNADIQSSGEWNTGVN